MKSKKPNKSDGTRVFIALILCLLGFSRAAFADAISLIGLGGAADYAVLGEGGTGTFDMSAEKVYQSATVIDGNVGMGPYTSLTHYVDATINGRFDYDLTDDQAQVATQTAGSAISGGVHRIDLSGVVATARTASHNAAALAPSQTFATLDQGVIFGGAGVNVIRITGDSTIKTSLNISGSSSSIFIFQFTSSTTAGHNVLSLSGMTMNLLGGVQANNIIWDFDGAGGDININAMSDGQTVYGTFLAPERNILSDHGIIDGRLIGGGSGASLSIHSGSEITTPSVPDGGSTVMLLGLALASFAGLKKFLKFCEV
jgi:hypothetical protein